MGRHVGDGLKAWGVSNTLKSKTGGSFARSERIDPSNAKNQKVTSGFKTNQVDERTVSLTYVLGDKHGLTSAAERLAEIEKHLDAYTAALSSRFKIRRGGSGEQQYLIITELPNPVVAQTLREAAEKLKRLGGSAATAAAALNDWAQKAAEGEDW